MDRTRIALVCQHLDCLSMHGRTAVHTGVKTIEVTWPLRMFDLYIENDGACTLVLVRAESARSLRDDPVYILSATQSMSPLSEPIATYMRDLTEFVVPAACERLYTDARITPQDVDVAELYDATSFMALKSLETWGFVEPGQAWRHLIEY